jgi:ABC-type Mn2+/Zn2+ transport system ATPase subunit
MLGNDMFFDQSEEQLKKKPKQIHFTLPYLGTPVDWNNGNRTYIIGYNGSGKTLLLKEMMKWCDTKGYGYAHYDAVTALSEAEYYIANASDENIIFACKKMSEFSMDFNDDIMGWAKWKNGDTFDQIGDFHKDVDLLKHVLGMCGAGYTRMFFMMIKALENPTADYYFMDLPETSMHIMLAERIVDFLMTHFEYMRFAVATHSPEVVKDVWNDDGSRDKSDVIEMNFNHIEDENNRKFEETFA